MTNQMTINGVKAVITYDVRIVSTATAQGKNLNQWLSEALNRKVSV